MKNIEKYPKTADALKAYAAHRKSEGLPLEEWLDREYVAPRKPIRNVDGYATAEEADKAFNEMCRSHKFCKGCPFKESSILADCHFTWLYAKADAER